MPYGSDKMLNHDKQMYLRKVRTVVEAAVTQTAEQIYDDLGKTFEKCIDEFYSYETRYYYRHEVGRGTKSGWNLYLANQMKIVYEGDVVKDIYIGWDGTEMLPYFLSKGKEVSTEHVIDNVMEGIRFNGDGSSKYPKMKWKIKNKIQTQYFGTLTAKTPDAVFDQMLDLMFDVQKNLASQNFNTLYNKMMQ